MRKNSRVKTAELLCELERVDKEMEHLLLRAKILADELGARYAVFRCDVRRHEEGRENRNTDIMNLSRKTDDCIQMIYSLEQRRRELLHRIGK